MGRSGRGNNIGGGDPGRVSVAERNLIEAEAQRTGLSAETIDKIDDPDVRQVVLRSSSFDPTGASSRNKTGYGDTHIATYYKASPARNLRKGDLIMDSSVGRTAWEVVSAKEENGEVELQVRKVDVQSGRPLGDPYKTDTWRGPENKALLQITVPDHETRDVLGRSLVHEGYKGAAADRVEIRKLLDAQIESLASSGKYWDRMSEGERDRHRQSAWNFISARLSEQAAELASSMGESWDDASEERQGELRNKILERQLNASRSQNEEARAEVRRADIEFRARMILAKERDAIARGVQKEGSEPSPDELRFWAEVDSDECFQDALSPWQPLGQAELRKVRRREESLEFERELAMRFAREEALRTHGKPLEELDPDLQDFLLDDQALVEPRDQW